MRSAISFSRAPLTRRILLETGNIQRCFSIYVHSTALGNATMSDSEMIQILERLDWNRFSQDFLLGDALCFYLWCLPEYEIVRDTCRSACCLNRIVAVHSQYLHS
ncbi:unnamed protein product [Cercospora beticola]|nr:unnamed protein product [Cercospora beticola]